MYIYNYIYSIIAGSHYILPWFITRALRKPRKPRKRKLHKLRRCRVLPHGWVNRSGGCHGDLSWDWGYTIWLFNSLPWKITIFNR